MKNSIIFLLLFLSSITAEAQIRRAHLFKIIDTNNPNHIIREAGRTIEAIIEHEFTLLVDALDMELEPVRYDVSGDEFTFQHLKDAIESAVIRSHDVVVVMYAGHGFRSEYNPTYYPAFGMPESPQNSSTTYNEYFNIVDMVLAKSPAVLLNLVVSCQTNKAMDIMHKIMAQKDELFFTPFIPNYQDREASNYQNMFRKAAEDRTLVVDLLSADIGAPTFISKDGGIFFNEFIRAFHKQLSAGGSLSWETIADDVRSETAHRFAQEYPDLHYIGMKQMPFCAVAYHLAGNALLTDEERSLWNNIIHRRTEAEKELRAEQKTQARQHKYALKELNRKHHEELRSAKREGKNKYERNQIKIRQKQQKNDLITKQRKERDWLNG